LRIPRPYPATVDSVNPDCDDTDCDDTDGDGSTTSGPLIYLGRHENVDEHCP